MASVVLTPFERALFRILHKSPQEELFLSPVLSESNSDTAKNAAKL